MCIAIADKTPGGTELLHFYDDISHGIKMIEQEDRGAWELDVIFEQ